MLLNSFDMSCQDCWHEGHLSGAGSPCNFPCKALIATGLSWGLGGSKRKPDGHHVCCIFRLLGVQSGYRLQTAECGKSSSLDSVSWQSFMDWPMGSFVGEVVRTQLWQVNIERHLESPACTYTAAGASRSSSVS